MFGIEHYGLFIVSGIMLNITPGTDTIYILSRSISQGKKAGVMSVLGINTGAIIHTFLAALGLSVIVAKSTAVFSTVKYLGAAYLIYLGIKNIFAKNGVIDIEDSPKDALSKIYIQGIMTNVLNPKVVLFYLAFLPQFISKNNSFGVLPFILLGLTFVTTGTIWSLIVAFFSSLATEKLRGNSRISSFMNKLTGLLFIGLGINIMKAKA